MSGGLGPPAIDFYRMVSGIGDSFSEAYKSAKKDALNTELGDKIRSGDFNGAADAALRAGELPTGLALVKLGEGRGATDKLASILGPAYGNEATTPGGATPSSAVPFKTNDPVAEGLQPQQKALLNAIAGGESGGQYNVRFTPRGGALFDGFGQHPNIAEMGPDGPSTAAGRYQFTKSSWDRMGGGDFSPANQDRRALQLASEDYRTRTGRDLDADLAAGGFSPAIQRALSPTWRALAGDADRHAATYADSLARYRGAGGGQQAPVQVASAEPDAANMPAPGMQPADFRIPPAGGASPQALPRAVQGMNPAPASDPTRGPAGFGQRPLGRPGPTDRSAIGAPVANPGGDDADPATAAPSAVSAAQPQPQAARPVLPEPLATTGALARAGVPLQAAAAVGRAAPGSPDRVRALIRASLIPGLSEQQQGLVKTLLGHELDRSKDLTSDQKEYAQGLAEGFKGGFLDWKAAQKADRTRVVQGPDGQQYVINVDTPDAAPRPLSLPGAVRVWGSTGADGKPIVAPPNVPPGTAGYYDPKGTPQLITGKGVNVTTNVGGGEGEESKELGKLRAKRAEAIEASAMKAPDQIGKLDLLGRVLDRARTGTFGPTEGTIVGFAQSLGIPDETIKNLGLNPEQAITQQAATKLINESVVGMIGAGGFPANNFSNSDREFLTDIFPKISNRPEANKLAIDVMRRVQSRNLEMGDAWAQYQQDRREAGKPVSIAEFEFNFRKGLRDKPGLFDDLRQEAGALSKGGGGGVGGGEGASTSGRDAGGTGASGFDPSKAGITTVDAMGLKRAPDTAENRRVFDERYGAGAAQYVLGRPLAAASATAASEPAAGEPAPLPKGKDRIAIPGGQSSGAALAKARAALAARPDQRAAIAERLRTWGIDPSRLDETAPAGGRAQTADAPSIFGP